MPNTAQKMKKNIWKKKESLLFVIIWVDHHGLLLLLVYIIMVCRAIQRTEPHSSLYQSCVQITHPAPQVGSKELVVGEVFLVVCNNKN